MGVNQSENLMYSKGNPSRNRKTMCELGENICSSCIWWEVISKIHNNLPHHNRKKKNSTKKSVKDLRKISQKDTYKLPTGLSKSAQLMTREMQTTPTVGYHLRFVRRVIVKR